MEKIGSMKKISVLLLGLIIPVSLMAKVSVSLEGPINNLITGEQFKLTIVVSGTTQRVNATFPSKVSLGGLAVNFDQSEGTSIAIVNGAVSYSFSKIYYYQATRAGSYKVKSQKVKVGGKYFVTNSVTITISNKIGTKWQSSSKRIQGNIFFEVETDKAKYYKNEQIIVKLMLYYRITFRSFNLDDVKTNSRIWQERLSVDTTKDGTEKLINGRPFEVKEVARFAFFVNKAGKILLPQYKLNVRAEVRSQFFGLMSKLISLRTDQKRLEILELPQPSASFKHFSGDVGKFKFKQVSLPKKIKKGAPFRLRVTVAGEGNLIMLASPTLELPKEFTLVNTREINNYMREANGVSGDKTFEFILRVNKSGSYQLKPTVLDYYDSQQGIFKSVNSGIINLTILESHAGDDDLSQPNMINTSFVSLVTQVPTVRVSSLVPYYKIFVYFMLFTTFFYLVLDNFLKKRKQKKMIPLQKIMNNLLNKNKNLMPGQSEGMMAKAKAYCSDVSEVMELYISNFTEKEGIHENDKKRISEILLSWKSLAYSKNKYEFDIKQHNQDKLVLKESFIMDIHKETLLVIERIQKARIVKKNENV